MDEHPRRLRPLVIAHRGASGHRPEHTLASYRLAIQQGADFIEPDLVPTRDGVLVARHENEISGTTDVAEHPEFANRRTTKTIDAAEMTGWFTEDFTLAELKTLRARERIPELRPGNTAYDGLFQIPTLEEIIRLAQAASRSGRRAVGLYPETKHPSYFASIGLPLEEALVRTLHLRGYRGRKAPVFIQSFEVDNLRKLRGLTDLPLVQLMDATGQPRDFSLVGDTRTYTALATPAGLAQIASYASAIGVHKAMIVPRDQAGRLLQPASLVRDAQAAGLHVHAWTFRSENHFLPADFRRGDPLDPTYSRAHGNAQAEYTRFFELGLDGAFSDFPDAAVTARGGR